MTATGNASATIIQEPERRHVRRPGDVRTRANRDWIRSPPWSRLEIAASRHVRSSPTAILWTSLAADELPDSNDVARAAPRSLDVYSRSAKPDYRHGPSRGRCSRGTTVSPASLPYLLDSSSFIEASVFKYEFKARRDRARRSWVQRMHWRTGCEYTAKAYFGVRPGLDRKEPFATPVEDLAQHGDGRTLR